MEEPKKKSRVNDSMPHEMVIAAVQGASYGVGTVVATAMANKLTKKTPPKKTQRKK